MQFIVYLLRRLLAPCFLWSSQILMQKQAHNKYTALVMFWDFKQFHYRWQNILINLQQNQIEPLYWCRMNSCLLNVQVGSLGDYFMFSIWICIFALRWRNLTVTQNSHMPENALATPFSHGLLWKPAGQMHCPVTASQMAPFLQYQMGAQSKPENPGGHARKMEMSKAILALRISKGKIKGSALGHFSPQDQRRRWE